MVARLLRCLLLLPLALAVLGATALRDTRQPEFRRVVVLANSNDPGSLELARHYCTCRGIPSANIIALPMPLTETVSWPEFVQQVWEPLAAALARDGWIDWIEFEGRDIAGRRLRLTHHHALSYLVLCRGVPLRIAHDDSLRDQVVDQVLARKSELQSNRASVDSELALLPQLRPPLLAYVSNPLFANQAPSQADLDAVLRVSRLDGPTLTDAMQLVDRAIEAETRGLIGKAYVDTGGIYPEGDRWFEQAARLLQDAAFEVLVDKSPSTFPAETVLERPILYLGWYAGDLNGPFAQPQFRFPAGAIAYHLHSFSAQTLRSPTQGWAGPLVARGATVTFGNVYEPYLALTHRPDLLMRALLRGWPVGAAGACATPGLGWQATLIGDPLYRPFAVPLAEQARRLAFYDEEERRLVQERLKLQEKAH